MKKKFKLYVLVMTLFFMISYINVNASEINNDINAQSNVRVPLAKEVLFEIEKDYEACAFTINIEHIGNFQVSLYADNSRTAAGYTTIKDGNSCEINIENVKAGKWKIVVEEIIEPNTVENVTENENISEGIEEEIIFPSVDEIIGKVQVSAKAIDKTAFSIGNVNVARDIVGLKEYFKDNSIVIEWTDNSCGNVNIAIIDAKTAQILDKQTVKENHYEFELPELIEEITIDVVPSTSAGIAGANTQYTLVVENNPLATVTYENKEYVNTENIPITIEMERAYSLLFLVNGNEVKTTGTLSAGTYTYEIPISEGFNEVLTYVVDEKHNMRSTSYSVTRDSIKPALTLNMEYDGMATYDNAVDIIGTIKDYEVFTINEVEPVVAGDGSFKAEYILKDGENALNVRAVDIAGNETIYTATIFKEVKKVAPIYIFLAPIGLIILLIGFFVYKKKNNGTNNKTVMKEKKEKKAGKETIELKWWIKYIILFIVVVIASQIFFTKVLIWGSVPSSSMAPTLNVGDVVFCNGLAYVKHEPQRGDIIVFTSRLKGYEGETITKRIIGLPGDDLMFIDGYIYLNGELVYEEYIAPEIETNSFADFIVPEGCYFVMGDNRENSYDSREWDDPYVREEDIRGKVMVNIPIEKLKNTVKTMFNTTERE